MSARILVGCPTSLHKTYCLHAYAEGIRHLTYPFLDILLVDNSEDPSYTQHIKQEGLPVIRGPSLPHAKERIVASRNLLRERFLQGGYDYLFSLEQDVIPPADILERLLAHGKKIISGVVFTRFEMNGEHRIKPLLWGSTERQDEMRFMDAEVAAPGLYSIRACGLGCLLIHRDVLEKIPFRLLPDRSTFDDIPFCRDCVDAGFDLYADTSVKCQHLIEGMNWDAIDDEEKNAGSKHL